MKYLKIRLDEQIQEVALQTYNAKPLDANILSNVMRAIESALMYELIHDDAIFGGKRIEDICKNEGISVTYFKKRFLPAEYQNIKERDLGVVTLVATHGDCPMCGFDMEANGRKHMVCVECGEGITKEQYYEL